jgi:signal transduction histidine kinase
MSVLRTTKTELVMPGNYNNTEQKRIEMISRLSVLVMVVTVFYSILDRWLQIHVQAFIYIGFAGFSLVTFFLNQAGRTKAAKAIGLLGFNGMIFLVASSEPFATGIHLYLFAAGAVALCLYNHEDWHKAAFFASLSTILYILVYLGDFSIIARREFSADGERLFFVINASLNAFVCIYSFLSFSKLNYLAEKNLLENEKLVLEQNSQLTKINKELDSFVYSVSHDLRAPLSSISGLIQLIERTKDPGENEHYLNLMKGRIARLDEFIRDIINFSRNARSDFHTEEVNVNKLLQETFEMLKFTNEADSIVLEQNVPNSVEIITDKTRLQIVLFNLISNAIQYRDKNKNPSYIKFSCSETPNRLALHIDDNGIGIDHPHHSKIFNMFYRATETSKGSGLGLYIVKETVEKLDGSIFLQSVLGEGTRFTIELPVQRN